MNEDEIFRNSKTYDETFLRLRIYELEEQILSKEDIIKAWEKVHGKSYPQYINPLLKELFGDK